MHRVRCWLSESMNANLSSSPSTTLEAAVAPRIEVERIEGHVPKARVRGHEFVALCLCPRMFGLSIEIDLTPSGMCNYDCVYCTTRHGAKGPLYVPIEQLEMELETVMDALEKTEWIERAVFPGLESLNKGFSQVVFSGKGEPTRCTFFLSAVRAVIHQRARGTRPFFDIVLLTNGSLLNERQVASAIRLMGRGDEIVVKLDAGEPEAYERVTRSTSQLETVLSNIREVGIGRRISIQTVLFEAEGMGRNQPLEIAGRICELLDEGVEIERILLSTIWQDQPGMKALSVPELSRCSREMEQVTGVHVDIY